jgi:hypothetical protein
LDKCLRGVGAFEKAAAEKTVQNPSNGPIRAPKSVTLSEEPPSQAPRAGRPRTHVRLSPPRTQEERLLVRNVCEVLRAILRNHGRYPLQAPGLSTRDMLTQVAESLQEGLKKGGLDFFCCASSAST